MGKSLEVTKRCRSLEDALGCSKSEHRNLTRIRKRNSLNVKNNTAHSVRRHLSNIYESELMRTDRRLDSRRPSSLEANDWKRRYGSDPIAWAVLESQCPELAESVLLTKTGEILTCGYTGTHRNCYLLGSSESCDIRLGSDHVDPKHCVFYRVMDHSGGKWEQRVFVADRGPTGVWINNVKVDVHRSELLRRNDIISFCDPACAPEKSIKYKFKVPPRSLVTLKERSIEDMYCRRDLIGNGAFGAVSYVQCLRTGKKFALKRARLMRENDIKVIYQEIAVHMSIEDHPNIIQLERAVVFDDTFYLVMELGGDGDLFKLISGTPLAEDEIRIIFDQIAHALAFLHDQEITHRDLKLENVMVADRNKLFVKLGDFGFSRFSSTNSPLTTRCGTPFYCAPELLPADGPLGYTKAVDIWALGVMLYSVFTMSMPFAVDNPDSKEGKSELDEMIRSSEPFYDPRVWRKISPEAKHLVQSMMAKDPNERLTIGQVLAHPWFDNIENTRTRLKGIERCTELKAYLNRKKTLSK